MNIPALTNLQDHQTTKLMKNTASKLVSLIEGIPLQPTFFVVVNHDLADDNEFGERPSMDEPCVFIYDATGTEVSSAMADEEYQVEASIEVDLGLAPGSYQLEYCDSVEDIANYGSDG